MGGLNVTATETSTGHGRSRRIWWFPYTSPENIQSAAKFLLRWEITRQWNAMLRSV